MLIQLTYASRCTHALGPADVKDILRASQRNNASLGVTGALCLSNGIFLQQLEGDRVAVNALYHVPPHSERYAPLRHGHFGFC